MLGGSRFPRDGESESPLGGKARSLALCPARLEEVFDWHSVYCVLGLLDMGINPAISSWTGRYAEAANGPIPPKLALADFAAAEQALRNIQG